MCVLCVCGREVCSCNSGAHNSIQSVCALCCRRQRRRSRRRCRVLDVLRDILMRKSVCVSSVCTSVFMIQQYVGVCVCVICQGSKMRAPREETSKSAMLLYASVVTPYIYMGVRVFLCHALQVSQCADLFNPARFAKEHRTWRTRQCCRLPLLSDILNIRTSHMLASHQTGMRWTYWKKKKHSGSRFVAIR